MGGLVGIRNEPTQAFFGACLVQLAEAVAHGGEGVADAAVVAELQQAVRQVGGWDVAQAHLEPLGVPVHKPQLRLQLLWKTSHIYRPSRPYYAILSLENVLVLPPSLRGRRTVVSSPTHGVLTLTSLHRCLLRPLWISPGYQLLLGNPHGP
eukprot:2435776-Pyramimonas_sp.AAC.2